MSVLDGNTGSTRGNALLPLGTFTCRSLARLARDICGFVGRRFDSSSEELRFHRVCRSFRVAICLTSLLQTQMCSISTQTAAWAFAQIQYRRYNGAVDGRKKSSPQNIYTACWDCWDLLINPRGIGWNWPRGLVIPKRTDETDSRINFILRSAAHLSLNALAFDVCMQTIRALGPDTFGSLRGGTLFDHSLPPVLELLRSVLVSALAASSAYFILQCNHQFLVIVFVGLLRQPPSRSPPLFDSPWLSASLGDLWGRRWHQLLRDIVLSLGGQPFDYLFGRLGGVLGAFLVSGIFHDIELRSLGRGGRSVAIVGFWVMNGVGVVLERVWKKVTGRSVGGVWGRIWMAGWLLLWGIPTVDAYAQVGRFAALQLPLGFEPSRALVVFACRVFSRS